jgi:hypothetical protein
MEVSMIEVALDITMLNFFIMNHVQIWSYILRNLLEMGSKQGTYVE